MTSEGYPPLIKGALLLLTATIVLLTLWAVQAIADEPEADPPAAVETVKLPVWGLHCFDISSCEEKFSEYFDNRYEGETRRLEALQESLQQKSQELTEWDASLNQGSQQVQAIQRATIDTVTSLQSCVTTAMEELNIGSDVSTQP